MNEQQLIQQFLDTLDASGLPEDRKGYWLERMASDDFSDEEEKSFEAEMEAHVMDLDTDIHLVEFQNEALLAEKKRLLGDALPSLKEGTKEAPGFMEAETAAFKRAVLGDEKAAMDEIEGLRSEKESDEIEAIRKRLGKG